MVGPIEYPELILLMSLLTQDAGKGPLEYETAPQCPFSTGEPLTTAPKYGPLRGFGILICCSIEPLTMRW
jgi:hypothetical protein